MGSVSRDGEGYDTTGQVASRAKLDRRAEALRANLKRRKAQTRARGEARHDDPQPAPKAEALGQNG